MRDTVITSSKKNCHKFMRRNRGSLQGHGRKSRHALPFTMCYSYTCWQGLVGLNAYCTYIDERCYINPSAANYCPPAAWCNSRDSRIYLQISFSEIVSSFSRRWKKVPLKKRGSTDVKADCVRTFTSMNIMWDIIPCETCVDCDRRLRWLLLLSK